MTWETDYKAYFLPREKIPVIRFGLFVYCIEENKEEIQSAFSVRMDKAEWVNELSDENIPDKFTFEKFLEIITNSKGEDAFFVSGYQYIKSMWNVNNPNNRVSMKGEMPDYSILLKDCKDDN